LLEAEALLDLRVLKAGDEEGPGLTPARRDGGEDIEREPQHGPDRDDVAGIRRLARELIAVPLDLEAGVRALLAVELPCLSLRGRHEPRLPVAAAVGLVADEFHPGVVARVVDDVGRRGDEVLDRPREPAVEALEKLGLVAEQPRSCWRFVGTFARARFGIEIGPRIGPRGVLSDVLRAADCAAVQGVS
jgi:hypothetical protein